MVAILSRLNFTFNTSIQSEQVRLFPYFLLFLAVGLGNGLHELGLKGHALLDLCPTMTG